MVVKISKRDSKASVKKALAKASKKNMGFQPDKFFGKLVRGLSGINYQKQVRDEWN
jgi:hypothetical protein